jgi:hypothetical protein
VFLALQTPGLEALIERVQGAPLDKPEHSASCYVRYLVHGYRKAIF